MTRISDAQIASYALNAGLSKGSAVIAVAIALAESGGDTQSHNGVPPDDSYGLWQINMLGSMGPARRQQFGITSNTQLYDPTINARAMKMLSNNGQNWRPWTTYTRGTYRAFLARASAAVGTPGDVSTVNLGTQNVGLTDGFSAITDLLGTLRNPTFWIRLSIITVGFAIAFYGFMKATGDNKLSGTTKGVAKAAIGLIPGGGTATQVVKGAAKVVSK